MTAARINGIRMSPCDALQRSPEAIYTFIPRKLMPARVRTFFKSAFVLFCHTLASGEEYNLVTEYSPKLSGLPALSIPVATACFVLASK
jgi:hypothetical protein